MFLPPPINSALQLFLNTECLGPSISMFGFLSVVHTEQTDTLLIPYLVNPTFISFVCNAPFQIHFSSCVGQVI